jgi:IclR family transcriptional regulator, pca regulon regulatory protein
MSIPFGVRVIRAYCDIVFVMRTVDDESGEPKPGGTGSDFVQSLERGLAVIQAFSATSPRLTLSDVARSTGLTRAASRRFLLTLQHLGFVDSNDREFFLTPRILQLGYTYLSSTPFWDLSQNHIEELVEKLHESSSMSVLDRDDVVYVARVPTKRIMTISLAVGSRLPAYPTSMGRVLLAGLADEQIDAYLERVKFEHLTTRTVTDPVALRAILLEVREQGWAMVDQELEDGVRSVAAPLMGANGKVIGAVNVSAHATRTNLDALRRQFLPALMETTARINADLSRRR